MRKQINSLDYWKPLIIKNRESKEKIFQHESINKDTMYIHYIIYNKEIGIKSRWTIVPNFSKALGYIKYCILPQAYYELILGQEEDAEEHIPVTPEGVVPILKKANVLDKETEEKIKNNLIDINKLWRAKKEYSNNRLARFINKFNVDWLGDSTGFLYLKVLNNTEALHDFIVKNNFKSLYHNNSMRNIGFDEITWRNLCKNAYNDLNADRKLKEVIFNEFKEII
ncbi:MAG: hypothetical protein Q4B63_02670 [Clostridium perfringens]|nr:hypothetical protein [Clostridium perfringens]